MDHKRSFSKKICLALILTLLVACSTPLPSIFTNDEPLSITEGSPPTLIPTQPKPTATAVISPTPEIEAQHIVDLVEQDLITVAIQGAGIDALALNVQSNTADVLNMTIPAGTYFVAQVSTSQNMVVRHTFTTLIQPNEKLDINLDAACANLHLDEPGESDIFTILRTAEQAELSQVINTLSSVGVDYEIEQAAIWIVTDNANFKDLGILVGGFGFGSRLIDENEAVRAMMLIQQAGVDILKYAIWGDRELLALNVTEPDLVAWLGERGVTVVVQTTPAPGNGEISQFATSATASSQYSDPSWSAMQAVGAPNTAGCGDKSSAWASLSSSGKDWLLLTYDQPVIPARIVIYQTYHPGAVTLVEVIDADGNSISVYTADQKKMDKCPYMLEIEVKDVNKLVHSIRITIDQRYHNGWNEIDAVQLLGKPK